MILTTELQNPEEKLVNVYLGGDMFCDISYYEIKGNCTDSPPVIFIHGLGSSKKMMFHTVIKEFYGLLKEKDVELDIIAIDMPGHGNSQTREIKFSVDAMVITIKSFMEAMDIEKAHFYGMSMGGTAVIRFASEYPELVETLTVQGPPVKSSDWGRIGKLLRVLLKRIDFITKRKSADFDQNGKLYVKLKLVKQGVLNRSDTTRILNDTFLRSIVEEDNLRFSAHATSGYTASILETDVLDDLYTIRKNKIPVLCIDGEKEKHKALDTSKTIKKYIPEAKIKLIPNTGHIATILEPLAVAKEFIEFLLKRTYVAKTA